SLPIYVDPLEDYREVLFYIVDELPFKMLLCPSTYEQLGYQLQLLMPIQLWELNNTNDIINNNINTNGVTNTINDMKVLNKDEGELIILSSTSSPLPSPKNVNINEQLSSSLSPTNSPIFQAVNMLSKRKPMVTMENIEEIINKSVGLDKNGKDLIGDTDVKCL